MNLNVVEKLGETPRHSLSLSRVALLSVLRSSRLLHLRAGSPELGDAQPKSATEVLESHRPIASPAVFTLGDSGDVATDVRGVLDARSAPYPPAA